jgi:hypothetical protein
MGLFDNLKNKVDQAAKKAMNNVGNKTEEIVFPALPDDVAGFKALPQAALTSPFETAALTVVALCFYPENKDASIEMLNYLRGPRPLSGMDLQFLKDRFMDKDYVPRSYFKGAVPENDYVPSEPFTVSVSEDPYTYDNEGYAYVVLRSGGADSPRKIMLRLAKDGKWYLWEQYILVGIRPPESTNPWA